MRLVLIEDSATAREELLERVAAESTLSVVGVATTASQGLSTVLISRPDAVIADLSLPDGSGLDMLRELRNRGYHGRMLVFSASPHELSAVASALSGANAYYDKSDSLDRLIMDLRDMAKFATLHRYRVLDERS